jgi:hypothetical protein
MVEVTKSASTAADEFASGYLNATEADFGELPAEMSLA